MKQATAWIVKTVLSFLLFVVTAVAVWLGGGVPDLVFGNFFQSGFGPLGCLPFIFIVFPLCCCVVGLCGAWIWKKCLGFRGRWGFLLAIVSFIVTGFTSGFLFEQLPLLAHGLTFAQHVAFHVSASLFSSQVAFWGFSGVMRIGWKRRRVGS